MMLEAIISDWNGTLFKDIDEESIVRAIVLDIARSYLPWHPEKMLELLKIRREIKLLNTQKTRDLDSDLITQLFRIFSDKIIKNVPMSLIRNSVAKYARKPAVQGKLLRSMLRPVCECHQAGIMTGILSAGYEYGIQTILRSGGYFNCFDFFEANHIAESGDKATVFNFYIYRNKAEVLLRLLKEKNLEPGRVAYMGDSMDDAGCFELVGYPIVSMVSTEQLKKQFAAEYKAFVPTNEAQLSGYLKTI